MIKETIDLCSNMLALVLSTFISYVGYCMTGFDLPTNYVENPEALLRRTKAKQWFYANKDRNTTWKTAPLPS